MIGAKEICALFIAGSMGAGSVVAVQQTKAPQAKSRAKPAKPYKARMAPRPAAPAGVGDCPMVASVGGAALPELTPIEAPQSAPVTALMQPGAPVALAGGGGLQLPPVISGPSGPSTFPGTPIDGGTAGVPQPAAWAMMVFGFGFVGMSIRRKGRPAAAADRA